MRSRAAAVAVSLAVAALSTGPGAALGCRSHPAPPPADEAGAGPSASPGASPAPPLDPAPVLARARVPAVAYAAVTRDGAPTLGAAGKADLARGVDATPDTVFEAASIGKLVVAACVMQLVEQGATSLDADVSKAVGFPVSHRGHAVTLRMLLAHTAAVRDHDLVETADVALGDYLRRYFGERRATAFRPQSPGAAYAYSNVGYALLAYAVEQVAAESFQDYARRRVLAPLGMTSTSWSARGVEDGRLAVPYAWSDGGHAPLRHASHAVWAAADLRSSARDLARFARMLVRRGELDGARVLAPESVASMLAPVVKEGDGPGEQGLGFQLRVIGDARVAGHEGEDDGASAALFVDPTRQVGAVVLANGDAFASDDPARASALSALVEQLLRRARDR